MKEKLFNKSNLLVINKEKKVENCFHVVFVKSVEEKKKEKKRSIERENRGYRVFSLRKCISR